MTDCNSDLVSGLILGVIAKAILPGLQYSNAKFLYDRTKSVTAKTIMELLDRNKDVPSPLLRQFIKEQNDYLDSIDPKRKWHHYIEFRE